MSFMTNEKCDIVIIGAGLTGLALAYFLKDSDYNIQILEARSRIGGRIHTLMREGFAPMEMGATWLGKKHTALTDLLDDLQLEIFEQRLGGTAVYEPISTSPPQIVQLPPNDQPSYRIKGGSEALIRRLADEIKGYCPIHLEQAVTAIEEVGEEMLVRTSTREIRCAVVVSTLPPYLLLKTIKFSPELPPKIQEILTQTHTWMGESIKVGLHFRKPFWRSGNLSGTIFSNVGPIPEMYDHADFEDKQFALKGFLNGVYHTVSKAERLQMVLRQLRKYYGNQVNDFVEYEEAVWCKESFTFAPYESHILPHQNNGHPVLRKPFCNGKLFIGGSETAEQFPGYMDGAVRSAKYIFSEINSLKMS